MDASASIGSLTLAFSFLFNNFGLPIGIPPVEDARVQQMAPDQCLYYLGWSGSGTSKSDSANKTERLIAATNRLYRHIDSSTKQIVRAMGVTGPQEKQLAEDMLVLIKLGLSHPASLYVRSATMRSGRDLRGGLIVSTGKERKQANDILVRIAKHYGAAAQTVTVGKHKFRRIKQTALTPSFTWGMVGTYLVLAVGDGEVEDVLRRSKTATPAWLADVRKRLAVPRVCSVGYVNLQAGLRLLNQMQQPQIKKIIAGLGVDQLKSFAVVSGLDEKGFVERSLLRFPRNDKGILSIFDLGPIKPKDLAIIPHDTQLAFAASFDFAKTMERAEELYSKMDALAATQFSFTKIGFETLLGFRIRQDLLQSLGDKWYIFNVPGNGGLFTSWTMACNVRDRKKLVTIQTKLLAMAKQAKVQVRHESVAGHNVYCATVTGPLSGLFPSWCITKQHLVVGLYPQAVTAFIRRDKKRSLADNPQITAALARKPGATMITYSDSKSLVDWIYPLLLMGWQSSSAEFHRKGLDLNVALLPSLNTVSRNVRSQIMTMSRGADGLEWRSRQSLPSLGIATTGPVVIGLTMPAIEAARTAARLTQSRNMLKTLAVATHNFHENHGKLPAAYTVDRQGKPLLSWRVMILPYIEEAKLYEKFKLDEPWDSPHNKKLIPLMPALFLSPASRLPIKLGRTNFQSFRVKNSMIVPPGQSQRGKKIATGIRLQDVTDGTTVTLLYVEASDKVAKIWTKPDDFVPMKNDWRKGIFGLYKRGANVVFGDGHFDTLKPQMEDPVLRAMIRRNE